MSSANLVVLAFVCPFAGALLGCSLRRRLPEHHLATTSTDAIRLAAGVVATLVALILGLLVSSANSQRAVIVTEQQQALAGVLLLDDYLAAMGPETTRARDMLRGLLPEMARQRWPDESFPGSAVPVQGGVVEIGRQVALLEPADAAQRWLQAGALQSIGAIASIRSLIDGQQAGTAPLAPVFVLVFVCSLGVFTSFSLLSETNLTTLVALTLSAMAFAGATFLILELNNPFQGLLRISSVGVRSTIEALGP